MLKLLKTTVNLHEEFYQLLDLKPKFKRRLKLQFKFVRPTSKSLIRIFNKHSSFCYVILK